MESAEETGGRRLYFAYGSNMSAAQMAERCPGATALGAARLAGWKLRFDRPSSRWGGFVADIVASEGAEVWGVLWRVTDAHMESLDRFEGVSSGAYRRIEVSVSTQLDGRTHRAEAYAVCDPARSGRPSDLYLGVMVAGAMEHRLPAEYVRQLRAFAEA